MSIRVRPRVGLAAACVLTGALASASCRDIAGVEDIQLTNPGCDGVPTDLENDPDNCGVCGHSCLGGACKAGACQAQFLLTASSGVTVYTIRLANKQVFVLDDIEVITCDPDQCGSTTQYPVQVGSQDLINMVVDPKGTIYYSSTPANLSIHTSKIFRRNFSGTTKLVDGLIYVGDLAITPDKLFYMDYGTNAGAHGMIGTCDLPDCATPHALAVSLLYSFGAFPSGDNLYWLGGDTSMAGTPYSMFRCSISSDCATPEVITKPGELQAFNGNGALLPDAIAVTTPTDVLRVGLDGVVTPFATKQQGPTGLSVFGTHLFWAESNARAIWDLDTKEPGAKPVRVWSGTTNPTLTAADERAVYFVTTDGAVSRVAR